MISMSQKQEVLLRYFREGQSKKGIARDVGLSPKTVRKYIREHEAQRQALSEALGSPVEQLVEQLTEAPRYDSSGRGKRRLTEEICQEIEEYLEQNREKRRSGRHKQVLKKIDIHECLLKAGYQIGYTTVCNYIRRAEDRRREAYVRQVYEPGHTCEFDWGEVKLLINGEWRTYQLAVFTAAMSNYRWAWLFDRQDTASFQQAHAKFFAQVEGVYYELVYDNTRVVIRRFVGRQEKEPTQGLLQLSMYYQFGFRFCNVMRGNEKGHVERSVEYIRRKVFGHREEFDSRDEANAYLLEGCLDLNGREQVSKGKSAMELLAEERAYLGACPPVGFECGEWKSLRVDKYSTINVSNNFYSVPDDLVGRMVDVKVYPGHLLVHYQQRERCRHERRYTHFGWYIELEHYLETLRRKPGALAGSLALRQAQSGLRRLYDRHFKDRPREFVELLHYQRDKDLSVERIEAAIASLYDLSPRDISLDKIRVLCERQDLQEQASCPQGAIEQHAAAQLEALSRMLPGGDSLTVQSPVI